MNSNRSNLVIWLFLFCTCLFAAPSGLGVVLVCRMPGGISSQSLKNGSVEPSDVVNICVGKRSAVVSPAKAAIIDSLLTAEKQKVIIKIHGKNVASFYFNFKDYGTDTLCFWYNRGYGTWSLESMPSNHCNCKHTGRK